MQHVHTLIIGSGAAGLCAAVRLRAEGINDILIATESVDHGTSVNAGSDKQTYYKISLYGNQTDSPRETAQTLFDGGSMHGDIALTEAALSARTFLHLADLGVKFPTDSFGQFAGYKTDHDPRQRAASAGPYTSRDMCRVLIRRVKELKIPIQENFYCIKLMTLKDRVCGAVFLDEKKERVTIISENIVFAAGGPGGLYENSVYPQCHTGSIGLALEIGAEAQNLPESQFGLASTKFRWNVSGTYMQVVPQFVSTDQNGNNPHEFLTQYFDSSGDLFSKIFLKGYQWPFDVRKVIGGSSVIDLLVYIETVEHQRRVFLDYRNNPAGLVFDELIPEAKEYLEKSGALFGKPIHRLEKMNPEAVKLYAANGIDLRNEMLEIAVCAQHNNGGLAGTIWWESTNIKHLFPIGEVNGSHGVTRPGGSALNAGQVGAFRAAEYIANRYSEWSLDFGEVAKTVEGLSSIPFQDSVQTSCNASAFRRRMSQFGAFIRRPDELRTAVADAWREFYRNGGQLCLSHAVYLDAISYAVSSNVGSRGSGLVTGNGLKNGLDDGRTVHPKLDNKRWNMQPENESFREKVLMSRYDPVKKITEHRWDLRRPIPETELWFESVWHDFRNGKIY
jgi:succinate dehydrogenase/fumarate reductase flavoprotein subunit